MLFAESNPSLLDSLSNMQLDSLKGPISTYFSVGAKGKAEKLQNDIKLMNEYYQEKLGINIDITLAILNPEDWEKINTNIYGLPNFSDGIIFMPATSGGAAFQLMQARKDSIPQFLLNDYLEKSNKTFKDLADDFVDLIGFHELGHILSNAYGISSKYHWLSEFTASYFSYTYVSEKKPISKKVFEILGRPSAIRPKNTTLEDFEILYGNVDDYGWYQGMFESRIQQLYPEAGIQFIKNLKREFPVNPNSNSEDEEITISNLKIVLKKLENIAPGFLDWANNFKK